MNKSERPIIVPTANSSAVLLWSAVLVALFGAAVFAYGAWTRLAEARERLATPSEKAVATEFFRLDVPPDCLRYVQETNRAVLYFGADGTVPFLSVFAQRDSAFAYRALDLNPALLARRIAAVVRDEGATSSPDDMPVVVGTTRGRLRQGAPLVRAFFNLDEREGLAFAFFLGDVRYFVVACWDVGAAEARASLRESFETIPQFLGLPAAVERFSRPVVNSAALEADEHARIDAEADRERALWRLFAERVKTEPEAALLPAIEHFRRVLALKASIGEEKPVLASDDFRLYEDFLARRRKVVADWFVLLDKQRAVGDLDAASAQAAYVIRHATLEDESLLRRRAAQAQAAVEAEKAQKGRGN